MKLIEYFSQQDLDTIHATVLKVLKEKGVRFPYAPALDLFKKAGCRMDGDRVFFSPKLVESSIKKAPSSFSVYGRNQEKKVAVGGGDTVFIPVYGPPFIEDLEGGRRDGALGDFVNFVRLCHNSPVIQVTGGVMAEPTDVPVKKRGMEMVFASLKYSDKPFMGAVLGREEAIHTINLAAMVMGGKDELAKKPPCLNLTGAAPPLAWDDKTLGAMMEYAAYGIPVFSNTLAIAGLNAPVTLEGALVIQTAEILSGVVLIQLVREGAPLLFSASSTCANMQNATLCCGAPEMGIFTVANCQLARYYGLPVRAGAGATDAKISDIQAGYETMMNLIMASLAGADILLCAAGSLDSYMLSSLDKFIIDEELCLMCQRIKRSQTINETKLAYEVIDACAYDSSFIAHMHTFDNFRKEFFISKLSTKDTYEEWIDKGRPAVVERARQEWQLRLREYVQPEWDRQLEKKLRNYINSH